MNRFLKNKSNLIKHSNNGEITMLNNNSYPDNSLNTMNPAPRCPVILLLDTSSSMSGAPINELNAALGQFIKETSEDEAARMSIELEVITFDDAANIVLPFTPISNVRRNSVQLNAHGKKTCMGAALDLARTEFENRRRMYRNSGISSYRPWVILMTDGGPNDDWVAPAEKMRIVGEKGKINYLGIEIGPNADHQTMCQILPANAGPFKLQGLNFINIFSSPSDIWEDASANAISDQDIIKLSNIPSWADLARL